MSRSDRKAPRLPIQLDVEFNHQETGVITLITKDISDSGVFIKLAVEEYPPIGTVAKVKLKNDFEDGEEPPTLEMKVVRHSKGGIGLEFIL